MDKYPLTRVSVRASRVLVRTLLTRQPEVVLTQVEFALLEQAGLNLIIQQGVKSNGQVSVVEENTQSVDTKGRVELVLQAQGDWVENTLEEGVGSDPIEACRQADKSGIRADKIEALRRVWSEAFPVPEYEYSQLSDSMGRWLTKDGRSAEWVGETIQRVGERWKYKHLESPVGYMRRVVEDEERKRVQAPINRAEEEDEVDMALMAEMARAWQMQKSKDSRVREGK